MAQFILRFFIIAFGGYGTFTELGIFNGSFNGTQLAYYTILSNLIILLSYTFLVVRDLARYIKIKKISNTNFSSNIMGMLMLMIATTGIIYNFILLPNIPNDSIYSTNSLSNSIIHTYIPLWVFFDWSLFSSIKQIKNSQPFRWLLIPILYWMFSIIYASFKIPFKSLNSYYAYFFIDADKLGWLIVFRNVVFLSIFFLLLGYLLKHLTLGFKNFFKKM